MVRSRITVGLGFGRPGTRIEGAVEGLFLINPELEVTLFAVGVARESSLGLLLLECVKDLAVGDVAHLEVFIDDQTFAIANATLSLGHHGVTSIVCLADIAVYTLPAFFTLAFVTLARQSVVAIRQRATQRL